MPEDYPQEMATAQRLGLSFARILLGCTLGVAAVPAFAAHSWSDEAASARAWVEDPTRHFRPARVVLANRAVLLDEAEDPGLEIAIADDLRRLYAGLYGTGGWRNPFGDGELLKIYVARRQAGGERRVAAQAAQRGRLVGPAILLDASRMSTAEIVREVGRQIASATLAGYGVAPEDFLTRALAEYLSNPEAETPNEEAWMLAAAPLVDFGAHPLTLGRLWIAEAVRVAREKNFLRDVWEQASESGEAPLPLLLRRLFDSARQTEETLLLRAAARLYVELDPEASPSRLRALELESGALDAAAPASLTVRHRSFLPENDTEETLRMSWPDDGSVGAAVVRYRDAALPPDVVFFDPGDRRAIPLSGVARIDWVVAGAATGGGTLRMPVLGEPSASIPYAGLEAHVSAARDGPKLHWTTASHDGLWGWAVFREEVLADGRVARTGPEIVPSSERSPDSFRYVFIDRSFSRGTFYRYTVWAVTDEGLLARAFSATLKTAD